MYIFILLKVFNFCYTFFNFTNHRIGTNAHKASADYRKCFRVEKPVEKDISRLSKTKIDSHLPFRSGQAATRKQVAEMIGVDRKTVGHWIATYASEGLDALLARDYSPGRPPRLSQEQQELLRAALKKPGRVFPVINR